VIRAVIFDLGGVIVRTEDFTPRERMASRLGMTRAEMEHLVFTGPSGLSAQLGEILADQHWENIRLALKLSPEEIILFQDDFWGADQVDVELLAYIRSLRSRYRTALLSNAFSSLRHFITDIWKFADSFDEIIISAEVGLAKPDAGIYYLALERLGVAAHEAVFVDDFIQNVEGARSIGMYAIHFQSVEQARAELEQLLHGDHRQPMVGFE
jgi:HAD superfamily hydrolase (TIGR01549 family)